MWDADAQALLMDLTDASDEVNWLQLCGSLLYASSDDGRVYEYDLRARRLLQRVFSGHEKACMVQFGQAHTLELRHRCGAVWDTQPVNAV